MQKLTAKCKMKHPIICKSEFLAALYCISRESKIPAAKATVRSIIVRKSKRAFKPESSAIVADMAAGSLEIAPEISSVVMP